MDITPISVTELNTYVQSKIDSDEFLDSVYVRGEISILSPINIKCT